MSTSTRKKTPSGRKAPSIRMIGWGVLWVAACGFSFTVGLLAGRQTAPIPFDVHELEKSLLSLKGEVVEEKKKSLDAYFDATNDRTHLGFYDSLKGTERAAPDPAYRKSNNAAPGGAPTGSEEIKMIRRATALKPKPKTPVKIETPRPKPRMADTANPAGEKEGLTIQVASLKSPEDADKMVARLKSQGFDAYKTLTRIKDQGIHIRVRVGAFTDRTAASDSLKALQKKGYQPIIVQR